MNPTSWAVAGIFFAIAIILFIFVIARTVYRCFNYHDCCGLHGKTDSQKPNGLKKNPSQFALELNRVNANQKSASGSDWTRNASELFDPSRPLELPVHGIHYPDPGEEEKEDIRTGGHNVNFSLSFDAVGYDEPDDKTMPRTINEERSINADVTVHPVPEHSTYLLQTANEKSEEYQDLDKADIAPSEHYTPLARKNEPENLESDAEPISAANHESEQYQELNATDIAPTYHYQALVIRDEPDIISGIDNHIDHGE